MMQFPGHRPTTHCATRGQKATGRTNSQRKPGNNPVNSARWPANDNNTLEEGPGRLWAPAKIEQVDKNAKRKLGKMPVTSRENNNNNNNNNNNKHETVGEALARSKVATKMWRKSRRGTSTVERCAQVETASSNGIL